MIYISSAQRGMQKIFRLLLGFLLPWLIYIIGMKALIMVTGQDEWAWWLFKHIYALTILSVIAALIALLIPSNPR